jgi:hypothetical protein
MTNPSLTIAVAAVAGITGVPVAGPGLAKSPKQVCYTAPLPVVVVRRSTVPQFITVGPMAIGLRQRGAAGSTTVRSGFMTATDRVAASAGQRDAPASEPLTPDRKPDTRSSIRGTSGNRQAHAAATTRPQKEGKEISDQIVDRTVPLFIKPISRPGNHRLLTMAVQLPRN